MIPFKETIETKQELIDACRKGFDDYCAKRITKNDFLMYFGFTHGEAIIKFYGKNANNQQSLLIAGGFEPGSSAYFSAGINAWKNLKNGIYIFPPISGSGSPITKTLNLPLQTIFYGAPGTGKSYKVNELTKGDDTVIRTTFHPDYDYAQFVGCYKPTKENKKETEKQVILDYSSLVEKFKEYLAVQPINITKACTLFGYDYHDSLVKIQENGHTIAQILEDAYKGGTTYSSQIYAGMTVFETSSSQKQNNSSITYSFVPQVFTNALVKAYESHEPVYLVIEEINRGNCAQIFGDIFQLLDRNANGESEYAINVDEDLKKYLEEKCPAAINDGKIKLPSNFNIIATMNTSDQSLFPMDSAFKRRWEWEYVPVNYGDDVDSAKFEITIDDKIYNWHTFLKAVNAKIKDVTKSEDKQMGNFFIKGNVDAKAFCNKVMFYLWNDVSKDYYESNDSLFQYIEDDSKTAKHFSFNELFGDGQTELLKGFMKFIGCDPVSDKSEEQKAKEEEESQANE